MSKPTIPTRPTRALGGLINDSPFVLIARMVVFTIGRDPWSGADS